MNKINVIKGLDIVVGGMIRDFKNKNVNNCNILFIIIFKIFFKIVNK